MVSKLKIVSAATMLAMASGNVFAKGMTISPLDAQHHNATKAAPQSNANGGEKVRVIVKFSPGKSGQVKSFAQAAGGDIKVDLAKHDSFAVEMPAAALNGLRNNPNVEFVETDLQRRVYNTNLSNTEVEPWGISRVEGDIVSDSLAGNRTVCIIDSGYDINNSDLANNQVSGTNDSGTGNWFSPGGSHGTHVAGTIAGMTNGSGVIGVMPNGNIDLHIIKVFNESGWGYSSSLIAAVDDCVAAGSDVINMSLGGGGSSTSERNAFESYYSQGVLSIAAAGNDGNTALSYPASYDAVVAVAAVDSGNMHANFSQRTNQVELSGPGEAVLSSVGIGDGQLAQLTVGGTDYFANGVVPHIFYNSSLSYSPTGNDGSATGTLGVCTTSGTSYSCGDMTGKICLVERAQNQGDTTTSTENNYPEYRAANACADAGAEGIVIYSNAARPGLQAPFLIDFNSKIQGVPTASVDRATGLALAAQAGQSASMSKAGGQDWDYYNGTSMATPHVAAVAALVWSYHETCSAAEIRSALAATAEDLDVAGRDVKTGYGLVKAQAAIDYLTSNGCTGGGPVTPEPTELVNGTSVDNLSGGTGEELEFQIDVPAGASDLVFTMSGGTGDADLYVSFGSMPTTSSYECRPYASGNSETCSFTAPSTGTYFAMIRGYSSFSGVSLVANYQTSGPNVAPTAAFTSNCTDLSCSFNGGSSSDSDGSIAAYSWDFGDGNSATGQSPAYTYSAAGDYVVTLTVTDNDGATDTTSQTVTVTEPVVSNITLTVSNYKVKGTKYVDLSWSGANGNNVDIHRTRRGSTTIFATANDGAYTDSFGGGGNASYKVCEAGTNNCSDTVTAVF